MMSWILVPGVYDALEVSSLERCASDESAVDVRLCEELWGVACLARAAIEDRCLSGSLCSVNVSDTLAYEGVYLLSLLCCRCLACSDSPDWLVGDDDVLPLLCCEVEDRALELSLYYLLLLVCLTLVEALAAAEDALEAIGEGEVNLLLQYLRSLVVVLTALRVAEDDILCTCL